MNSETETLLLDEVEPRLRAAIPKRVPMVGCEDADELVQDGLVIALRLQQSAACSGKKLSPGNLAHYTVLALCSGRRSTGVRQNDVLHPAAQLNGHARLQSLDEPVSDGEHGEEALTLHDCLGSSAEDPATAAARRLDWQVLLNSLDRILQAILVALIEGRELTLLVRPLGRSRSALHSDKVRLGRLIQACLGQDILPQAQARPAWRDTLDALQERRACRANRSAA